MQILALGLPLQKHLRHTAPSREWQLLDDMVTVTSWTINCAICGNHDLSK